MVDQFVESKKPPQESYLSFRRDRIRWAPAIDSEKCNAASCGGFCVKYCPFGVFELSSDGLKAMVKNPVNCNVGDESCRWRCPEGAIGFPSREDLRAQLRVLRQKEGFKRVLPEFPDEGNVKDGH